ncbi:N-acetylmuramoyl-L-alanine amidase [Altererythrobacter indicus]|uniref:N-acetylmuramoyl-L-alanine amidase n=1 Tax=Altericroceibacterium indicum TaxID=374177 RepID=A0A845A7U0_9SPHN|nr:N-acetylmuramoyl-L-alanine amidase [Altericroceibacterium indicum]MXP25323.1 N-acetylmuramoyl-L-alanine amidase [Altericroceibacterium indicum]
MSYRLQIVLVFLGPLLVLLLLALLASQIIQSRSVPAYVIRLDLPLVGATVNLPNVEGPQGPMRPLIVIDAGHGGHDPGANGSGVLEKTLTLQLAKSLRKELLEQGGFRVALTRDNDSFLVVEERFAMARKLRANLFISLHADSAGPESSLGGASVYTLSTKASSEAAARFASRENAESEVNGALLKGQDDEVSSILVELSQRHTQERSVEFAELILREGHKDIHFLNSPLRSAALRVLRAPDVPSVLYEAGFITNPADEKTLASSKGQQNVAEVLARAIRVYFIRHPVSETTGS